MNCGNLRLVVPIKKRALKRRHNVELKVAVPQAPWSERGVKLNQKVQPEDQKSNLETRKTNELIVAFSAEPLLVRRNLEPKSPRTDCRVSCRRPASQTEPGNSGPSRILSGELSKGHEAGGRWLHARRQLCKIAR